jgi:hypothetical protein
MFKGSQNSTDSTVTDCELDGLGFKCWWEKFFDTLRSTLRLNQPLVQWVPGLFAGHEVARVWRWPPTPSSAEVMYTKSYNSISPLWLLGMQWNSLYIYPYSSNLQAYNNDLTRTFKYISSGSRLPDLTPICATFNSNSRQTFNVTHKMSVYFTTPLTPLSLLCNSRHITTIQLRPACKSISTVRTFCFSIPKICLSSSTSANVGMSLAL